MTQLGNRVFGVKVLNVKRNSKTHKLKLDFEPN